TMVNLGNERNYNQTPTCDTLHFLNKYLKIKENLLVYNDYFDTILANVSANKGITLLPESYLDKVSDNLNYIKLEEYVREIGLISSSESLNAYVNEILSN
ncbi:LysR family transcriptional regulator, partial [Listeria monocytogenes]